MARDIYHHIVRELLEDDGWTITHDPLSLKSGDVDVDIDLAAERLIAAQRGDEKIALEIKSFLGKSKNHDFYEAKGQYDVYRWVMREEDASRRLFLAIEEDIFTTYFQRSLIQQIVEVEQIDLFVFNPEKKIIVLWKKHPSTAK